MKKMFLNKSLKDLKIYLNKFSINININDLENLPISGLSSLHNASENHITFFNDAKLIKDLKITKAKACFVTNEFGFFKTWNV